MLGSLEHTAGVCGCLQHTSVFLSSLWKQRQRWLEMALVDGSVLLQQTEEVLLVLWVLALQVTQLYRDV